MIGVLGAKPLGEGVMDGSTGSPTLFHAMPGETEIRGRLPSHNTFQADLCDSIAVSIAVSIAALQNDRLQNDSEDDVSRASFPSP